MKHRDLIDHIETAANAARTALIEGNDDEARTWALCLNIHAAELRRVLGDDAAKVTA